MAVRGSAAHVNRLSQGYLVPSEFRRVSCCTNSTRDYDGVRYLGMLSCFALAEARR